MNTVRTTRLARIAAGAAFSILAVTLSATAFAEPTATSVTVSYSDLNLSNAADARVLYRRLAQASSEVCGGDNNASLSAHMHWQRCYQAALEQAVMKVRSEQLLAVYRHQIAHGAHFS